MNDVLARHGVSLLLLTDHMLAEAEVQQTLMEVNQNTLTSFCRTIQFMDILYKHSSGQE